MFLICCKFTLKHWRVALILQIRVEDEHEDRRSAKTARIKEQTRPEFEKKDTSAKHAT